MQPVVVEKRSPSFTIPPAHTDGNNGNRDREMSTLVAIVGKFSQRARALLERVFTMIPFIHTEDTGALGGEWARWRLVWCMFLVLFWLSCYTTLRARWHGSDTEKCQVSGVEKSEK